MNDPTIFVDLGLPIALALIMAALGLSLTAADFTRLTAHPRGVVIGLANLFLLAPALAFVVAELFGLAPVFAVGLVLLGASPGGTTANLLTHLARGDTALSITMTALSSLAAVITVPLYLSLAVARFDASVADDVSMLGVVARVLLITVVPLALGMRIRSRHPRWALERQAAAKRVATVAFVGVVIAAVASEWETITGNIAALMGATITLNVSAMACSFAVSRLARLDRRQATAVAMELGVHNATLTIAVATSIDTALAIPAAVYSCFQFVTAGVLAALMAPRNQASARVPSAGTVAPL